MQKIRKNKLSLQRLVSTQPQDLDVQSLIKKQISQITQLFSDQDFTIDQFFKKMQKSNHQQQILSHLPQNALKQFLSRNYAFFIQTTQQLNKLGVPQLQQVKQSPINELPQISHRQKRQQIQQSSVNTILDSFNNQIFERQYKQALKTLDLIKAMYKDERYEKYFYNKQIERLSRQYYQDFVQNCKQQDPLIQSEQIIPAIKVFFYNKTQKIVNQISGALSIGDFDLAVLRKSINKLLQQIFIALNQFKTKYKKYEQNYPIFIFCSKWIEKISQEIYQLISPFIYQNQQLQDILNLLNKLLACASQYESKGLSLVRIFKKLTIKDLSYHIERFIEVIMDSFNQILKQDNQLFEMTNIQYIKSISEELSLLKAVKENQNGKICSSKKVILLINAYTLLLEPLFDKKWQFLHEKILNLLVSKSDQILNSQNFGMWDYYNLFKFFDQLRKGKLRKKMYNNFNEEYKSIFKEQYIKIGQFAKTTWQKFQLHATELYFQKILSIIPKLLWQNGKIYSTKQKKQIKPTQFSLEIVRLFKQLFEKFQFRISTNQLELLAIYFFQYFIYVIEYVVYISYHNNGQNTAVFLLPQRNKVLYEKAKSFKIKQLNQFQESEKKIFKLSYFSLYGMQIFVFEMHFISSFLNKVAKTANISAEQYLSRIVKIQQKQKKMPAVQYKRQEYGQFLQKSNILMKTQQKKNPLRRLNTN